MYVVPFVVVLIVSVVFSMFGKGGGPLYTPVLVMIGWDVGVSISTALFLNLVTALVATIVFARNRLVDFRFCAVFLPGTIAGSILGAVLSGRAPKDLLLWLFAAFLVVAGVLMIRSGKGEARQPVTPLTWRLGALIAGFSSGVGVAQAGVPEPGWAGRSICARSIGPAHGWNCWPDSAVSRQARSCARPVPHARHSGACCRPRGVGDRCGWTRGPCSITPRFKDVTSIQHAHRWCRTGFMNS